MCYSRKVAREISQRELRNESGEIMRAIVRGGLDPADLPSEIAVSAVTLAELAAGPHATGELDERARRQDLLQRTEAMFESLPVNGAVARAYGRVYAAVAAAERKAHGRR